jgi:trehalose 6-phosphate synthase/phosphatase
VLLLTLLVVQVADVAVVTATRDGMNLVPYEYVVCRQGPPGESAAAPRESMLVVSGLSPLVIS